MNNRCSRLRFETWNINGLITYKETAKIVIDFLKFYDYLTKKPMKSDYYKEIVKYFKSILSIYVNCITGNYINFAVCEYYQDDTFTKLSEAVFLMVVNQ